MRKVKWDQMVERMEDEDKVEEMKRERRSNWKISEKGETLPRQVASPLRIVNGK